MKERKTDPQDDARFHSDVEKVLGRFLKAKTGLSEARTELRKSMERLGYRAFLNELNEGNPDGEIQWLNSILRTNHALRCGRASWLRQQGAIEGFPAWRMVLFGTEERYDWTSRWEDALHRTTRLGASNSTDKTALLNHPIWIALSRFGLPYPAFDYDDNMSVLPVDRKTAGQLGILPGENAPLVHRKMMIPVASEPV